MSSRAARPICFSALESGSFRYFSADRAELPPLLALRQPREPAQAAIVGHALGEIMNSCWLKARPASVRVNRNYFGVAKTAASLLLLRTFRAAPRLARQRIPEPSPLPLYRRYSGKLLVRMPQTLHG